MVDTDGEYVNAVGAYFTYPEDILEAVAVNTAGSPMTLVAEEEAEGGSVRISGGEATPGFFGIHQIASIDFKVKATSGSVTVSFDTDSAVLRDSDNQNILNLGSSGKGVYTLVSSGSLPSLSPEPPPPLPPPPPLEQPSPEPSPPPPPSESEFQSEEEASGDDSVVDAEFTEVEPEVVEPEAEAEAVEGDDDQKTA